MEKVITNVNLSTLRYAKKNREVAGTPAITELAESISSIGLQNPIVVRKRGDGFEIVSGHRRAAAFEQLGLETIPASVRDYTDEEAELARLAENIQRADLHPIDEAYTLRKLQTYYPTIQDLSDQIGKSRAYIAERVKLLNLNNVFQKAFLENKINLGIAKELAKLTDDQQERIQKDLPHDFDTTKNNVMRLIEKLFHLKIAAAGWDLDDEELYPEAGSCTNCEKRTCNQPDLFGNISEDTCTDRNCFQKKKNTNLRKQQKKHKDHILISNDERYPTFSARGDVLPLAGYKEVPEGTPGSVIGIVKEGPGIGATKHIIPDRELLAKVESYKERGKKEKKESALDTEDWEVEHARYCWESEVRTAAKKMAIEELVDKIRLSPMTVIQHLFLALANKETIYSELRERYPDRKDDLDYVQFVNEIPEDILLRELECFAVRVCIDGEVDHEYFSKTSWEELIEAKKEEAISVVGPDPTLPQDKSVCSKEADKMVTDLNEEGVEDEALTADIY